MVETPPVDGAWGEDYYFCEGLEGAVATGSFHRRRRGITEVHLICNMRVPFV